MLKLWFCQKILKGSILKLKRGACKKSGYFSNFASSSKYIFFHLHYHYSGQNLTESYRYGGVWGIGQAVGLLE